MSFWKTVFVLLSIRPHFFLPPVHSTGITEFGPGGGVCAKRAEFLFYFHPYYYVHWSWYISNEVESECFMVCVV